MSLSFNYRLKSMYELVIQWLTVPFLEPPMEILQYLKYPNLTITPPVTASHCPLSALPPLHDASVPIPVRPFY